MEELDQRASGLRGNGGGLPAHTQGGQGYRSGPGYYNKQRPRKTQELGGIVWGITGLQEPDTTSTIRAQLTTTLDLNEVSSIIEANVYPEGLLERRIVWGEDPWRETNMLRAWEVVLEGKAYAKRPKCGNCTDCKGHPVPIATVANGTGSISSFCQSCWDWSDFHKHRPAPPPMDCQGRAQR